MNKKTAIKYLYALLDEVGSSKQIFSSYSDFCDQRHGIDCHPLPTVYIENMVSLTGSSTHLRLNERFEISTDEFYQLSKVILEKRKQLRQIELSLVPIDQINQLIEKNGFSEFIGSPIFNELPSAKDNE